MEPKKLLVILFFCLVLRGVFTALLSQDANPYYVDLAGQCCMYTAIFVLCKHQFGISQKGVQAIFGSFLVSDIIIGSSLAVILLFFTFGESAVFTLVASQFDADLAYKIGGFHKEAFPAHPFLSPHVLWFIVASVLLPAIVEEFFFRGLLFPALALRRTYLSSALICSAIFTVLHFSKMIWINTFIFAFVLCYLFARNGSLYCCVVMHAVYNMLAFIFQHYFDFHRIRKLDKLSSVIDWMPQLIMLFFSILVLVMLGRRYRVFDFLLNAKSGSIMSLRSDALIQEQQEPV
jgi:membrane protease YdiL (CAAX protease family)